MVFVSGKVVTFQKVELCVNPSGGNKTFMERGRSNLELRGGEHCGVVRELRLLQFRVKKGGLADINPRFAEVWVQMMFRESCVKSREVLLPE